MAAHTCIVRFQGQWVGGARARVRVIGKGCAAAEAVFLIHGARAAGRRDQ